MKNKLSQIKDYVNTKYGDLTGVIQIDGHDNINSIYQLCKDYGFDTKNIFIVGFGLDESTINGIGEDGSVYCKILYVKSLIMETLLMKYLKNYNLQASLYWEKNILM